MRLSRKAGTKRRASISGLSAGSPNILRLGWRGNTGKGYHGRIDTSVVLNAAEKLRQDREMSMGRTGFGRVEGLSGQLNGLSRQEVRKGRASG